MLLYFIVMGIFLRKFNAGNLVDFQIFLFKKIYNYKHKLQYKKYILDHKPIKLFC